MSKPHSLFTNTTDRSLLVLTAPDNIQEFNKEEDSKSHLEILPVVPSSPTNVMHSPTTTKLWSKSISKNHLFHRNNGRRYSLSNYVIPHPLPMDWRDKIILGSSSANRKQVIDALGWSARQISPDIDEKAIRTSNPYELPKLIAIAKADAIIKKLRQEKFTGEALIITADQVVLYQDTVREKPENIDEAIEFLSSYSNSHVSTISAVACTYFPFKRQVCDIDVATVHWHEIPSSVVRSVVSKGQIYTSAGGFRVEDDELNPLIKSIDGSIDSIFGLPVDLMINLMNDVFRPEGKDADEHYSESPTIISRRSSMEEVFKFTD